MIPWAFLYGGDGLFIPLPLIALVFPPLILSFSLSLLSSP